MQVSVIKIGNSRGIRLSKTMLEKYNIQDSVNITLEEDQIVITPIAKPRKNWDLAFKKMAENSDDELLMDDVFDDENIEAW